ncbi:MULTISPECIES: G5 and 3D domain-containing protein [unclassified Virgibacillus]|uniref:G5 and 3D domain-containing protein n=1 Tax=unclassified Virgibacillus TaxID=2620237 RepID=UPI0024DE855F|nr:G5 and 3D domain-containing protein [Virgibacillus sp. LDC-1]
MRILSKLLPASKLKLVISSIGVMALVAFTTVVFYEMTKTEVVFADNGEEQTVQTHAETVEDLLKEVGITIGEYDALSHSMDAIIKDGMKIDYDKANKVILTIDGNKEEYYTLADSIEDFFQENNLTISTHDAVSHEKEAALKNGMEINVTKAFQVTINDGGKEKQVWATGGSIKQLLDNHNITYNADSNDKINVALDKKVQKDTTVNIVRVTKETVEETEAIPYETEKKKDSSLEKGKTRILSKGEEGELLKKFEVTKENGKEVGRKLLEKQVKSESKNRVVAVGTKEPKPNLTTLSSDSSGGGKTFYVTASAFTAKCSGCSGYTTTGLNLKANPNMKVIAVDPSVIPLGKRVWVEGYGEAIAGDTGGSIVGKRIDVHVATKSQAYSWGVRKVKIKILN